MYYVNLQGLVKDPCLKQVYINAGQFVPYFFDGSFGERTEYPNGVVAHSSSTHRYSVTIPSSEGPHKVIEVFVESTLLWLIEWIVGTYTYKE